jgi:Fe2+ or Zn2+ uptake regulation protein
MFEFHDPALEQIIEHVCQQHNFQLKGHSFVIRGLCAECNQARSIKRRLDLV